MLVTSEINNLPSPESHGGLLGIECKFVHYVPEDEFLKRPDMHYVKEVYHYKDGTTIRNFKPIKNYQRSFWVTKEHLRKYKQKRETETLDRLNQYKCTQSQLASAAASRLGPKYAGCKHIRDIADSPYLYGTDIQAKDEIKYKYIKKYNISPSKNIVAFFDIEANIDTGEIILITIAMEDKVYTAILDKFISDRPGLVDSLKELANRSFPKHVLLPNFNMVYEVVKNEGELIKKVFSVLHTWQPDIVSVWNIDYDIPWILDRLQEFDIDPKDVFSDPRIPENYRYFYYKKDRASKVTASGVNKPPSPHELWHITQAPASFCFIDNMAAFNFVRTGQKQVPGGYSLDNILITCLGNDFKKLSFQDIDSLNLDKLTWHKYMQDKRRMEYVIYNQWDVISMLLLDKVIKDLEVKITALSGLASYDLFKSGPKKIVVNMFFFALERGKVLGCRPTNMPDVETLELSNWMEPCPLT